MSAARLWEGFVARLEHREPATSLALFRIAMGVAVLATLGPVLSADLVVPLWVDQAEGGFRPLQARHPLVELLGGPTLATARLLVGAGLLAGTLLVLGLGGRLPALLALASMMAIFSLSPGTGGGHDRLHTNGLWLLVLAPSTATLSLDARLFSAPRRWCSDRAVPAWARYLAVVQLVAVYCATGLQKVGPEWFPWGGGSALYYALQNPIWARFPHAWVAEPVPYALSVLGTTTAWWWEVLAPVWLLCFWFRATRERPGRLRAWALRVDLRALWAAYGLLMHLTLALLMNLGPFSLVTVGFYACLFHPDEWAAAGRRARALLGRAS